MQLATGEKLIKQWDYQKGSNAVSSLILTDKRIATEKRSGSSYQIQSHELKNCEMISSSLSHRRANKLYPIFMILMGLVMTILGFVMSSNVLPKNADLTLGEKLKRMSNTPTFFIVYLALVVVVTGIVRLILARDKIALNLKIFEKNVDEEKQFLSISSSSGATVSFVKMPVDRAVARDMIDTIGSLAFDIENAKKEEE